MFRKTQIVVWYVATSVLTTAAPAQQIYPVQRQSPEQQKQDEDRCWTWAMQQTGFDPAKPWLAPQASVPTSTAGSGASVRGGASSAVTAAAMHPAAGDAAVAGAIIVATQPAAGTSTSTSLRRETLAVAASGDGAVAAQSPASAAMKRTAATAATGADGAAITPPAATAAAAAILGPDASNLAAGGAVAGATVQRAAADPKMALQQERAMSPQQLAAEAPFQKARTACLEAHGYTVQ